MPAIEERHKKNFDTLLAAAVHGDLALVDCENKFTGKPVRVIAAVHLDDDSGEYVITPLAAMFDSNPYDMLKPPGGVECKETSR